MKRAPLTPIAPLPSDDGQTTMPPWKGHLQEEWSCSVLSAKEIGAKPMLKALTYTFRNALSWYMVGAQILTASGWRPDCPREDTVNVARALPPPQSPQAPMVITPLECLEHLPTSTKEAMAYWEESTGSGLEIAVSAFYQQGYGVSCGCIQIQGHIIGMHSWVMGSDPVSSGPPA